MAQQSFNVGAQINQNDLLAIRELVLRDSVARRKWQFVVDHMDISARDRERIRYLLRDHEYEEAVRHSLEIFRDRGWNLYKLLSVLRDVGLKDLADRIAGHMFVVEMDKLHKPGLRVDFDEVATKESKEWLGTTDLTHSKKLKPVQESSVPPTFAPLGSSKGIQEILHEMTRLVVSDPVALQKWSLVVEGIVIATTDELQIKSLLKEYTFEEAVLSSLRIWHRQGLGRVDILEILRKHGLNSLADQLSEHVLSLDLVSTTQKCSIWFDVGEVVHNFTGRQAELESLHKMLHPRRDTFSYYKGAVCISGLGGIGKTSLATVYAHTYKNVYDGGVIWVKAETEHSIRVSFTKLLKQHFGITSDMKTTTRQIAEMVHNHLRHRKVLMIFDNVVDQVHFKILRPLVVDPDNYILLTSRRTDLIPGLYNSLHLDGLSSQDANKLILSQLSTASVASATMLADKLERFPLAIQQATAYIKNRASLCLDDNQGVVEYVEEFDQNAKRLLDTLFVSLPSGDYALTTFSTWKPTLAQIEYENGGSHAIQVLNVFSYLNPENISVEFLQLLLRSVPKASSKWATLLKSFRGEDGHFREEDVNKCLHILRKFSMINLSSGKVGIHRLVQKVITLNLNTKEVKVIRPILDFLWIAFQKEQLTDHLRECVFHGLHLFQFQVRHGELMQERSKYLAKLCFYLNEYGNHAQCVVVAQEASSVFERMYGKNHESTIRLKLKLGEANARLHKFEEASKILDEILPISRSVLGEAHSLTLDIISALGRLTDIKEIEAQVAAAAVEVEVASDTGTIPAQDVTATSAPESTPKRIIWEHPPLDSIEESSEGNEKIKSLGIWFDVGEVGHNFVGRKEEIARLHTMIVGTHSNQSSLLNIVNICGLPGIGKSELARKYAAEYLGFYEGNVILINCETREEMRKSFSKLLASLRQPVRYGERDEDLACRAFEQLSNRCCLFIFDNVENKEDFQAFRPRIDDPDQYTPYILVTSRWTDCTPLAKNTLRLSDSRESKAEAEKLAVALGRLPLALQQAATYIKDTRSNVGSDEEGLRSYLHLFNENMEGFLSDKAFTGFFAAISKHVSQLSKNEARKLLVSMAYLNPSRISAQFLSKLFPKQTRRLLSRLEKLSLISMHDKRIEIHQLVQLVVRLSLEATEERDIVGHISGQLRVEILYSKQDTALARECTLHGLTLFPFQRKHPDRHGKYDYFIALCSKLDLYGNCNDSLELCEECLSSPDLDNESILIFKLQLVGAHCSMGDFDQAEEVLDKIQPMCQQRGKGERGWLSTRAMTLRAKIMSIRGEGEEAIKIMDEVIALRVQEHGSGKHPAVWRSLETQAIALLRLGKLDDAGKVFQSVYDQRLQRFGPEDVETLRTRGFLGEVAVARGEYKEALDIFESVHEAYNLSFGENNQLSAGILHSIALVYSSMGQVQKVLGIYDKIVQLGAKVLGERKLLECNQVRDDAYRQVMVSVLDD